MLVVFEWDSEKATSNVKNHRITFGEAITALEGDTDPLWIPDPDHSGGENRFITIGRSDRGNILVVWYTEREVWHIEQDQSASAMATRIIGARIATNKERENYERARSQYK